MDDGQSLRTDGKGVTLVRIEPHTCFHQLNNVLVPTRKSRTKDNWKTTMQEYVKILCKDILELNIGYFDDERAETQKVEIDAAVYLEPTPFEDVTDELALTVDYRMIKEIVAATVASKSDHILLEALSARICDALLELGPVAAAEVVLHKPKLVESGISAYVTTRKLKPKER